MKKEMLVLMIAVAVLLVSFPILAEEKTDGPASSPIEAYKKALNSHLPMVVNISSG